LAVFPPSFSAFFFVPLFFSFLFSYSFSSTFWLLFLQPSLFFWALPVALVVVVAPVGEGLEDDQAGDPADPAIAPLGRQERTVGTVVEDDERPQEGTP